MEQNNDIMIRVDGLKKQYRLGQIGGGTLRGDLQSWWARKRGKEDPNTKIGTDQRLIGQKFMALNGVSFTVKKGEAVGIIGSNGAGKSTLLKLLTHVTAPTEGTIDLYGRVASMLEVGTGFHPEMTGRENVYLNGAILGMTKEEIDAKMDDIIEFSEVRDFIDTPVKRYSSGMYVKLAFSVAAHLDSEIMIMDEVLAVGDMNFQQKCLNKMKIAAHEQGRTVLYVSHNMNTIRQLCDRCIVLQEGRIVYDGLPEKGICIYNSQLPVKFQSRFYFADVARDKNLLQEIKMVSLSTHNEGGYIISQCDSLRLILYLESSRCFDFAQLRFVVKTMGDEPVGTSQSEKLISIPNGSSQYELVFDTSFLPPRNYQLNLVLFTYQDSMQMRQDIVEKAFFFSVIDKKSLVSTPSWNFSGWGNVQFPPVHINKIGG